MKGPLDVAREHYYALLYRYQLGEFRPRGGSQATIEHLKFVLSSVDAFLVGSGGAILTIQAIDATYAFRIEGGHASLVEEIDRKTFELLRANESFFLTLPHDAFGVANAVESFRYAESPEKSPPSTASTLPSLVSSSAFRGSPAAETRSQTSEGPAPRDPGAAIDLIAAVFGNGSPLSSSGARDSPTEPLGSPIDPPRRTPWAPGAPFDRVPTFLDDVILEGLPLPASSNSLLPTVEHVYTFLIDAEGFRIRSPPPFDLAALEGRTSPGLPESLVRRSVGSPRGSRSPSYIDRTPVYSPRPSAGSSVPSPVRAMESWLELDRVVSPREYGRGGSQSSDEAERSASSWE